MKEKYLLTGPLEPTNEPYAIAKIAGIKMCESYNRQHGTRFLAVMPTNLYGPNDNFDLTTSHVLPALIRKFHEAKVARKDSVVIWGTGSPRREFLHVDDMAAACIFVIKLDDKTVNEKFLTFPNPNFVNVGSGVDHSIREIAEIIGTVIGYKGDLDFDTSKPDGTAQKLLSLELMSHMGWKSSIDLFSGIQDTYNWYLKTYASTNNY